MSCWLTSLCRIIICSSADSLFTALSWLCPHATVDAELLEMIERADTDADGEISPDEFYAIMVKKTFT